MHVASAADSVSILSEGINAIEDQWEIHIPQVFGMRRDGHLSFVVQCWSVRDLAPGGYDWHLVAVSGSLAFPLNGTLALDYYEIITVPQASGATLMASGPETTEGQSTTSTSVSKTLSSSVGFSGDNATGSIGASVTTTNEHSVALPQIVCQNRSQDGGEDGHWVFRLAASSPAQGSDFQFYNQMLWRTPQRGATPSFEVSTNVSIGFEDTDGQHGTRYYDGFVGALNQNVPRGTAQGDFDDRIGYVSLPGHTTHLGTDAQQNAVLRQNEWLATGDYLAASDDGCFCVLQADGNLCTYVGLPASRGDLIWDSGPAPSGDGTEFFLTLGRDGNLCAYAASGPPQLSAPPVWQSGVTGPVGDYFADLAGGFLQVHAGTPSSPGDVLWCAPTRPA